MGLVGEVREVAETVGGPEEVAKARAKHYGVPFVDLGEVGVKADAIEAVSTTVLKRVTAIPYEQRDGHIKAPDFLSAKEFPVIGFKSTSVEDAGDGNLKVTGDLDFRGKTKSITADVEFIGKAESRGTRIGYEARFSFKRSEFGSTYGLDNGGIGDEIFMIVSLESVKQ